MVASQTLAGGAVPGRLYFTDVHLLHAALELAGKCKVFILHGNWIQGAVDEAATIEEGVGINRVRRRKSAGRIRTCCIVYNTYQDAVM